MLRLSEYFQKAYLNKGQMDTYEGGSGGRRQKPCRACSDFKSWMQVGPNKSKTIEDSTEESNKNSALEMRLMDHRTSQQTPSTGKRYKTGYSCVRPMDLSTLRLVV